MKITKPEIDWMEGWANDPKLKFTVDKMPANDEYVYTKKGNLYFALHECGLASYFAHSPGNESGYGGREFTLQMADGTAKTIKGPWSSRCSVMNMHFPHTVEVVCNRTATYLDVDTARWLVEKAGGELVRREGADGEIRYVIQKPATIEEGEPSPMAEFTRSMVDKYGTGA